MALVRYLSPMFLICKALGNCNPCFYKTNVTLLYSSIFLKSESVQPIQTSDGCISKAIHKIQIRLHITPILASLHWFPVCFRGDFRILTITYNIRHEWSKLYLYLNLFEIAYSHFLLGALTEFVLFNGIF